MRKQKAKKHNITAPIIVEEQPEEYKKVLKKKQKSYSKLRDITDVIKSINYKY